MRLAIKIATIVGLTLALLVPLGMVGGTVHERQTYRAAAVELVARSSAGAQSLAGPVLVIPYRERVTILRADAEGVKRPVVEEREGHWVYYPQTLDAQGRIRLVPRRVGLYEVRAYELDARMRAAFEVTIPVDDDPSTPRTIGAPRIGVSLGDVRGLVGTPVLRVAGAALPLQQGMGLPEGRGVHAVLPVPEPGSTLAFEAEFRGVVQGTESLSVVPIADTNTITLESDWPHPQFHGAFLPRTRDVSAQGFRARWEISSLASDAQARFRRAITSPNRADGIDAVAVSLLDPVDVYTQVDRATKYGVLFVALTFVAFFMFEFMKELRIHPIQYGLVGLAIAIFFLLLLALSEHVAFGLAYVIAAAACVTLIGYYLGHVLGGWLRGTGFAAMLGALYAALYGLLISEDNAMLLGAGLLFAVLTAIMVLTRNVDWYRASASAGPLLGRAGTTP